MRRVILSSLVLDLLLVVVFAVIGRASHHESVLPGLFETSWPFVVALGVGWIVTLAWRAPFRPVRTGIGVWLVTVAGGMLLRAASGQGTAVAFIIVATIVLGVFLVGWRVIASAVARRRVRVSAPAQ